MPSSLRRSLTCLLLLGSLAAGAQGAGCTGEVFAQLLGDAGGQDVRLTCAIPYPGPDGDRLLGGTVGSAILLIRTDARGTPRWERLINIPTESTELSTLNEVRVDATGAIAGVGSTFNDNLQRAYVFRYDPAADVLRYFRQPDFPSEGTGLQVLSGGDYLFTGSRQGEPNPVFVSAFAQRLDATTGLPTSVGLRYDFLGDEVFLRTTPAPDGGVFAGGNISATGGAGDIRASVTRLAEDGSVRWTRYGPIPGNVNGRLYTFSTRLINGALYVLQWGNIGNVTGSINTTAIVSRLNPADGAVSWTRSYDLTDYNGESGIELRAHAGGLLVAGFSLIGKRDPWLLQLEYNGDVRWARGYELPGNAINYFRAGQQVLTDEEAILMLSTFSYTDGTARRGLWLTLDALGRSTNECLNITDLNVATQPLADGWVSVDLEVNELPTVWTSGPTSRAVPSLISADDCERDCADCRERSFRQDAICRGDSLLIANRWRTRPGVYADTAVVASGCDTIRFTELLVSDGPAAAFSVRRQCGLAAAEVTVSPSGGIPPYSYRWSEEDVSGNVVNLLPGSYTVTVADAIDCQPFVLTVDVTPNPDGDAELRVQRPRCPGEANGSISLVPAGSGALRSVDSSGFVPDALTGLAPRTYQIIVRDSTGCEAFRQLTVPPAAPVTVAIDGNRRVPLGDQTELRARLEGQSFITVYEWSGPGIEGCTDCSSVSVRPQGRDTIRFTGLTESGCPARALLVLETYEGAARIYLPTGFSPNGDAINDLWQPGFGPDVATLAFCRIYDRWGGLVWSYAGDDRWWDGAGHPNGVYTVVLGATKINGDPVVRRGDVTLTR